MTMHYRFLFAVAVLAVFAATSLSHAQENRFPVKQVGFTQYATDCAECQPAPMCDPCCPTRACGCGGCRTIVGEMLCDIKAGVGRVVDFARCHRPGMLDCCPAPACGGCGGCDACCGPRVICIPIPRLRCLLPRIGHSCGCPDCCDTACSDMGEEIVGSSGIIHERVVPSAQPIEKPSIKKEPVEEDPFKDDEPQPVTRRTVPRQLKATPAPLAEAAPPRDDMKSIVKRTSHNEPIAPATALKPIPQPLQPTAPTVYRPYVKTAQFSSSDSSKGNTGNSLRFKNE